MMHRQRVRRTSDGPDVLVRSSATALRLKRRASVPPYLGEVTAGAATWVEPVILGSAVGTFGTLIGTGGANDRNATGRTLAAGS